ncbi:MAG: hypothetical protein ACQEXJ_16325 [Myxococcota bacterium]
MSEQQSEQQPRPVASFTEGGHEVDVLPKGQLFGLILGLLVILVGSGIGVREFYSIQAFQHEQAAGAQASARLENVREQDRKALETWGVADEEQKLYHMPVDRAVDRVLDDPTQLEAAPAPDDFVHPDDAAKESAK